MSSFPRTRAFLGRPPAVAANAPTSQVVVTAKNNANTTALSNALKKYVQSIRALRNNPFNPGITRNSLLEQTKANRNTISGAIANYVMAVNKAAYLNNAAGRAVQLAQRGVIPEPVVAPIVTAAARQNNATARAAGQLSRRNALLRQMQVPPPSLENTVKAPNGRNIAVIRNTPQSPWRFKNQANGNKYTLINTTKNKPVIPVTPRSLFAQSNQGAVQTPRVLGGFEGLRKPNRGTTEHNQAVRAGKRAAENILSSNLMRRRTKGLRENLVNLKNIRQRYESAFKPESLETINKAIKKLAGEINQRRERPGHNIL